MRLLLIFALLCFSATCSPTTFVSSRRPTHPTPRSRFSHPALHKKNSPPEVKLHPVIVGTIDTTMSTISSYFSSFVLGYTFSGVTGVKTLFKEGPKPFFAKNAVSGKSWGRLGSYFTGFHVAIKHLRGNVDDNNTRYASACCAGAAMARDQGGKKMCEACVTYAGFSYLFDGLGFFKEKDPMQDLKSQDI